MKKLLFILFFLAGLSGAFAQEKSANAVIKAAEYKEQIQKEKTQLIDVRTPEEYADGHIEGAKNFDFYAEDFLFQFQEFDKEQPLYIYCRSGNRSGKASKKLSEMGFRVIDLEGGYVAWGAIFERMTLCRKKRS